MEDEDHEEHDHDFGSGIFSGLRKLISLGHSHRHETEYTFQESTEEGIRAVKLSFLGLMLTAFFQIIIVYFTGSVALLADTLHNFSDAFTSIPLWIAFRLSQRERSNRYSYGYGRAEDLAGLFIVIMIAGSAALIFYESINRLVNPVEIRNLGVLAAAAIIGFAGNEIVAQYRINKGKEINSEALIADGLHSRTDGLTSLSILVGVIGAWLGYPIMDAIIGLAIGILILFILRDAAESIFLRLMDGVDPELIEEINGSIKNVESVLGVHDTRARFSGRKLYIETHIVIDRNKTVLESHSIVDQINHQVSSDFPNLGSLTIHIDPDKVS